MRILRPKPTDAQARVLVDLLEGRRAGSSLFDRPARGYPATIRALIRRKWITAAEKLTVAGEQIALAARRRAIASR